MRRRVIAGSVVLGVVSLTVPGVAQADTNRSGCDYIQQVGALSVKAENHAGYEYSQFNYSGGDTRDTILYQEKTQGGWHSVWDGKFYTDESKVEIDHTVALSEAWDSGASSWDNMLRSAYGNNIEDPYALNAITAGLNSSKGDRDPAEWLPPKNVAKYLQDWVQIKTDWELSVDSTELATLREHEAQVCGYEANEPPPGPEDIQKPPKSKPQEKPKKAPKPSPKAVFHDKDCGDFNTQSKAQKVLAAGSGDPHGLDANHDGRACEALPVAITPSPKDKASISAEKKSEKEKKQEKKDAEKPKKATKSPSAEDVSGEAVDVRGGDPAQTAWVLSGFGLVLVGCAGAAYALWRKNRDAFRNHRR